MGSQSERSRLHCITLIRTVNTEAASVAQDYSGRKPGNTQPCKQVLNPSTSAKSVMTKLHNVFVTLVNMDIFRMTLKFSLVLIW